jgi:hypothetical protein
MHFAYSSTNIYMFCTILVLVNEAEPLSEAQHSALHINQRFRRLPTCKMISHYRYRNKEQGYRIASTIKTLVPPFKALTHRSSPPLARDPSSPTSNLHRRQPVSFPLSRPWQLCRSSPKRLRDRCAWFCLCESAGRWLWRRLR